MNQPDGTIEPHSLLPDYLVWEETCGRKLSSDECDEIKLNLTSFIQTLQDELSRLEGTNIEIH